MIEMCILMDLTHTKVQTDVISVLPIAFYPTCLLINQSWRSEIMQHINNDRQSLPNFRRFIQYCNAGLAQLIFNKMVWYPPTYLTQCVIKLHKISDDVGVKYIMNRMMNYGFINGLTGKILKYIEVGDDMNAVYVVQYSGWDANCNAMWAHNIKRSIRANSKNMLSFKMKNKMSYILKYDADIPFKVIVFQYQDDYLKHVFENTIGIPIKEKCLQHIYNGINNDSIPIYSRQLLLKLVLSSALLNHNINRIKDIYSKYRHLMNADWYSLIRWPQDLACIRSQEIADIVNDGPTLYPVATAPQQYIHLANILQYNDYDTILFMLDQPCPVGYKDRENYIGYHSNHLIKISHNRRISVSQQIDAMIKYCQVMIPMSIESAKNRVYSYFYECDDKDKYNRHDLERLLQLIIDLNKPKYLKYYTKNYDKKEMIKILDRIINRACRTAEYDILKAATIAANNKRAKCRNCGFRYPMHLAIDDNTYMNFLSIWF